MKKALALVLCLLLFSSALTGCGSGTTTSTGSDTSTVSETSTSETEGVAETEDQEVDTARTSTANSDERYDSVTVALDADPIDLLPHSPNAQNKQYITRLIYETLFYYENGEYVPILAEGYEEVDDTHWKVTIRDDIYDSAGNQITADDVVFSYNWLVETGYTNRYDTFGSVEKTGDFEVTFEWTSPIDSVAELDTIFSSTFVFSQASFEANNFATDPIGTGPYKLKSFTAGSEIVVEARDDYWAADHRDSYRQQANVQEIVYKIVPESAQNLTGLTTSDENSKLDISMNIPVDSVADFEEGGQYSEDFVLVKRNTTDLSWLTWNQEEGMLGSDINFRLACAWALNNEAIAKVAGTYVAADTMCSPSGSEYDTSWVVEDGYIVGTDLEKAKEYLEQSSYNGETLQVMCYNTEAYKNIASMIVSSLAQIGINAEVKAVDNNTFDADMGDSSAWDLASGYIGGTYLPSGLNRIINYGDFVSDAGAGFIRDEELLDKWETYSMVDCYDTEHGGDLISYIYDNCYFYPTVVSYKVIVTSADVAQLFFQPSSTTIWVNASEYYLD